MAFTVGQAIAVNTLIHFLLEDDSGVAVLRRPSSAEACQALTLLAGHAYKTLSAGASVAFVQHAWAKQKPQVFADPDYDAEHVRSLLDQMGVHHPLAFAQGEKKKGS